MQDTELFLSLAEIAGVFVGFGALIAVRSGGAIEGSELTNIRWVMSCAMWVVVAALAPVFVSRYGVNGHELWLVSSVVALVLFAITFTVNARTPENLSELAATLATTPRAVLVLVFGSTIWLPAIALVLALVLVVISLLPDQEQALYLTAVGLGLFMGAIGLFMAVFWQRRPSTPDDVGWTAAGGSGT